jgi:hypothetical protein
MKAFSTSVGGKSVSVDSDGCVYVNGTSSGFKIWQSNSKRYSNLYGQEIHQLAGLDLESALRLKGLL